MDPALIARDNRPSRAPGPVHTLGLPGEAGRAPVEGGRDRAAGNRLADGSGGGEIGISLEPAIERGRAHREMAREIRIVRAELAHHASLAGESRIIK